MDGCMICLRRDLMLFTRLRSIAGRLACFVLCQKCRQHDDDTVLAWVRERQAEQDRIHGRMVAA